MVAIELEQGKVSGNGYQMNNEGERKSTVPDTDQAVGSVEDEDSNFLTKSVLKGLLGSSCQYPEQEHNGDTHE